MTDNRVLEATATGWRVTERALGVIAQGRVRVRLATAGLCRTDVQAMTGQRPVRVGRVLGHEASGWVASIPPDQQAAMAQRGLREGDPVALFPFLPCGGCYGCKNHRHALGLCERPSALGLDEDGAFAQHLDLPPSVLVKGPSGLSARHLAYAEPLAAAWAVHEVRELGKAKRVAVVGQGRIASLTARVLTEWRAEPVWTLRPDQVQADGWDALVETCASASSMLAAVNGLRVGGLLVGKSRPAEAVPWPHQAMVLRKIRFEGAPYGAFEAGLDALAAGRLAIDDLLGATYAFTDEGVSAMLADEANGEEQSGKLFLDLA